MLTISDAKKIETSKVDYFLQNLKKVLRIVFNIGPAISKSDYRKHSPYQLPFNKIQHST